LAPRGGLIPVLAGVVVSAGVSFLVAAVLIKKKDTQAEATFEEAKDKMVDLKGKKSSVVKTSVKKIIVACDAGMGSSAMGASKLKNKIQKAGLSIQVANASIDAIPGDADIVISHKSLTPRAIGVAPNAEHISIEDFIMTNTYDELVERLKQ
jgi:PTS system mannitol-specific IIC component